ncbi:hypothetical protein TSAR_008209 [Trichomalopsis sarcophagae]|uniref:Uncharacterized protein n=1 Tax=Trichomalopsis sarcophagae TaxID=543379 RepID=A0A232ETZ1_9HYME|nr:hypothetical protein TSAR_008209 [Trichomalopsis sarcophagae]
MEIEAVCADVERIRPLASVTWTHLSRVILWKEREEKGATLRKYRIEDELPQENKRLEFQASSSSSCTELIARAVKVVNVVF